MPLNFQFEFAYLFEPVMSFRIRSPLSGRSALAEAHLDTGADRTILDSRIAHRIGLDLQSAPTVTLMGLGGGAVEAAILDVELFLLDEEELHLRASVAFAPLQAIQVGNLVGLDLLEHFDFGLSHRQRLGYLGRAEP